MNKKIILILLLFVTFIFGGVFYIVINNKTETIEEIIVEEKKETKYSKETTKILNNILLKRSVSGLFLPGIQCSSKDKCSENQITYSDGMTVMWALNRKYLNTRNEKYLNEISKISKVYSDKSIVSEIGYGDYPPCRFANEILKTNKKLEKETEILNSICKSGNRADYLSSSMDSYDSGLISIKKSVDKKIKFILNENNKVYEFTKYDEIIKDIAIESYPYFASDYYYLSFFDNKSYLEKSFYIYDILLEAFASRKIISSQFTCRLGQLSLDLYNVDKNENYLNLAKSFMPSKTSSSFNIDCAMLGDRLISDFNLDYRYYLDNYVNFVYKMSEDFSETNMLTTQKLGDRFDKTTRKNALVVGIMEKIYLDNVSQE